MNAIITGATKGIGAATAKLFAQHGFNLAICSRNEAELATFANALMSEYGIQVIYRSTDMRIKSEVQAFGAFVLDEWPQVDVLINNAGVYKPGDVHNEDEGNLELMIETNLYSAYHLTRKVIPAMMKAKSGHVFNICSIASITALPGGGSYSISKYAMMGFNTVLREEMKDKGVKVTAVLPGATWSNSWDGVELPYERLIATEDIAKSVWSCYDLGPSAVVEEIIVRPQLGDL